MGEKEVCLESRETECVWGAFMVRVLGVGIIYKKNYVKREVGTRCESLLSDFLGFLPTRGQCPGRH